MTWLERMNKVLDYIEDNLTGDIDMEQLVRIACYSQANLQRMFSIIADMPLAEYIRRRRLTLAAFDLQNSSVKIIDVALKYGYDSPEAFARAFSSLHGTTPSSARGKGVTLRAYPRISFLLTLKGAVPMDYRIETKESFAVYGIEGIFSTENGENLKAIPQFWRDRHDDGSVKRLEQSGNLPENRRDCLCAVNAICGYEAMDGSRFPYMLCAVKSEKSDTTGYKTVTVPAATWAIFTTERHTMQETSHIFQKLISRIYTDWLPTANYDLVDGYDMELYYGDGDAVWCEAWVRVTAKK